MGNYISYNDFLNWRLRDTYVQQHWISLTPQMIIRIVPGGVKKQQRLIVAIEPMTTAPWCIKRRGIGESRVMEGLIFTRQQDADLVRLIYG